MDTQNLINLVAGTAIAVGGWFARQLWDSVQALKTDLHKIEVDLPISYVRRDDLDKRMAHIETMFQRIYDKLDGKADK
jgi:predicted negative regulator of RcsB-dependent stress response